MSNETVGIVEPLSPLGIIGHRLKEAREQKGVELSEIAEKTRITYGTLQGIEEGHLDKDPGSVFVRGFIRTYANMVDLDASELQEQLDALAKSYQDSQAESDSPALRPQSSVSSSQMKLLALVGVVAVFIGLLVLLVVSQTNSKEQSVAEESSALEAVDSSNMSPEQLSSPSVAPLGPPLNLLVKASQNVWVTLSVDGGVPEQVLVTPEQDAQWPAESAYVLTIGDAKAVQLELNSHPLTIPSEKDLLVDWTIDLSTLESLERGDE